MSLEKIRTQTHTDDHVCGRRRSRTWSAQRSRPCDTSILDSGLKDRRGLWFSITAILGQEHSTRAMESSPTMSGIPWWSIGWDLVLSSPSVRVQSLVWELKSHKPCTTRTTPNNPPCLEGCSESHGSGVTVVPPTWAMEFCGSNTCGDPARAAGS